MSEAIREDEWVCEPASSEEQQLVGWAEDAQRKELSRVQECLRHMVTLTTALLAGSAALLAQPASGVPGWAKAVGTALLILALGCALWGTMPYRVTFDITRPDEIRDAQGRVTRAKTCWLRVSFAALWLTFVVLLVGVLFG